MEISHVTAVFAAIFSLLIMRTKRGKRRPNEPPLSPGLPYIGHGFKFISDFSGLMNSQRKKHGSIYTIMNFCQRMHFITDYKSIRKIWTQPAFDFREFAYIAEANFSGMETSDELKASGVGSATLAKYAHTMRGDDELNSLAERFKNALCEAVDKVPILHNEEWNDVDLREFCGMMIFYAAGRSLFGTEWLKGVDLQEATRQYTIFEVDAPAIAGGLPTFLTRKGCRARDYLARNVLLPIVKNGCDGHSYIVNYLRELKEAYSNDENGDLKIASRLTAVLFAINTNTMNLLFWTIARIQIGDESLRLGLTEESKKVNAANFAFYLEQKREMPLLNSVIIETFRLHGDPNSFRVVAKDCVVSGLVGGKDQRSCIPKG
jgi:cytochrome P450